MKIRGRLTRHINYRFKSKRPSTPKIFALKSTSEIEHTDSLPDSHFTNLRDEFIQKEEMEAEIQAAYQKNLRKRLFQQKRKMAK
jgi:hypothetical protein